jgi:hypothetical protein
MRIGLGSAASDLETELTVIQTEVFALGKDRQVAPRGLLGPRETLLGSGEFVQ